MNLLLLSLAWFSLLSQAPAETKIVEEILATSAGSELPFRLSAGYLIQVEGRIGTQDNLKFILDTGATISIVDRKIADKLKVERHLAESFNFDRDIKWESSTIPEIEFGPIRAINVPVYVGNLGEYSEFVRKADAIIGMDLLKLRDFLIDFDAKRITFHSSTAKLSVSRGAPLSDCVILDAKVQGQPVRLIVDTGLQGFLLYEDRLRKRVPDLRTVGNVTGVTMGTRLRARQAALPDVDLGRWRGDVSVLLVEGPASDMLPGIDGVIGLATLRAHRVDFDMAGKRLHWN